ncbi:MAG: (4Fe-4S)-binding protein [Methanothrix sp.]|nr:(4Fe-4S)-binding protein [Methanothrix sp.]
MKEYSNGEIVVCWQPEKCMHARECVNGLPKVFNNAQNPWINIEAATSEEIMKVIDRCPSGALTYRKADKPEQSSVRIKVMKNGPLLVEGNCTLVDGDGKEDTVNGPFALCRCGGSKKKPFCDGSHIRIGFDDSKSEQI